MLSQESDTNSEVIAENFLEQKIDSSSFIQKFLQERKVSLSMVNYIPVYISTNYSDLV